MDVRVGLWRRLSAEELMLFNCGVGEDSLRVSWTARRSNQSILQKISPEYSLERLMLKLKLQYFGHLMWRTDSLEKALMLGKIEGGRRRGTEDEMVWWHHRVNGHEFEQALGLVINREAWHVAVNEVAHSRIWLSDWTEQAFHWSDFFCCGAWALSTQASVVVVLGLSCPLAACGIFQDQGFNLYPLHWHVDSYPVYHQGNLKHFCKSALDLFNHFTIAELRS